MSFLGIHLFSSDFLFSNCLWNGGRSGGIPHFGVELTSVGNYWPITARKDTRKGPGKQIGKTMDFDQEIGVALFTM